MEENEEEEVGGDSSVKKNTKHFSSNARLLDKATVKHCQDNSPRLGHKPPPKKTSNPALVKSSSKDRYSNLKEFPAPPSNKVPSNEVKATSSPKVSALSRYNGTSSPVPKKEVKKTSKSASGVSQLPTSKASTSTKEKDKNYDLSLDSLHSDPDATYSHDTGEGHRRLKELQKKKEEK